MLFRLCSKYLYFHVILHIVLADGNPTFVYEVSAVEFTFVGSMKKLNCEALNFCSITWYKDGVPYPWKSSDHEHLEDRNQVLLIKDADFNDEGKYTCVVSNGKRSVSRSISLWVKGEVNFELYVLNLKTLSFVKDHVFSLGVSQHMHSVTHL